MKFDKAEILTENTLTGSQSEIEELDVLEENEEFYKWISILLGVIWLLSLMIF